MDLVLYLLFFFPGMLAFIYSGFGFAKMSLADERALRGQPERADRLAVQMADPDRRRADGAAGHRRGDPLHHLHPHRRMAASACTTSRSSTRSCWRRPSTANTPVVKELEEIGVRKGDDLMFGIGNPELGVLMLVLFVVFIMFGFPIAFTLMALGVFFGYFAMGDLDLLAAGAAHLFGDDERRADLDPAVRVHGLHHRARQHPRSAVQVAAARRRPDAGVARASPRSPPARSSPPPPASSAPCVTLMGLLAFPAMLRAGYDVKICRRRGLRRRLPRHSDPAERHADPVRRHRRRVGGQALCRRLLPRHHAGRPLHPLHA